MRNIKGLILVLCSTIVILMKLYTMNSRMWIRFFASFDTTKLVKATHIRNHDLKIIWGKIWGCLWKCGSVDRYWIAPKKFITAFRNQASQKLMTKIVLWLACLASRSHNATLLENSIHRTRVKKAKASSSKSQTYSNSRFVHKNANTSLAAKVFRIDSTFAYCKNLILPLLVKWLPSIVSSCFQPQFLMWTVDLWLCCLISSLNFWCKL